MAPARRGSPPPQRGLGNGVVRVELGERDREEDRRQLQHPAGPEILDVLQTAMPMNPTMEVNTNVPAHTDEMTGNIAMCSASHGVTALRWNR